MNFKKIIVLVMTFAMLISAFAPTLGVFAEEINGAQGGDSSEKLNYVSIGDSMTNGYGFEGYEQGSGFSYDFLDTEKNGGYGNGTYPLQFEEYLEGKGYDVTHTKLASSALRVEELLYLLGGREMPDDGWAGQIVHYTRKPYSELIPHYQKAIKEADVISMCLGNASFGAFFIDEAVDILGVDNGDVLDLTVEKALELVEDEEDKTKILEIYNKAYTELSSYLPAEFAEKYKLEQLADLVGYIAAGFLVNYAKTIDKIVEINESDNLEIILLGMINTTHGMSIELESGEVIPMGEVMGDVFDLLNAYIAGYPTSKQLNGEYPGVTFYFVEQPEPKFIVEQFDDFVNNGWENIEFDGKGRLSADIVRDRTIEAYNDDIRGYIWQSVGTWLDEISLEDVKSFNENEWSGSYYKQLSVAIYLAIEDAVVKSLGLESFTLSSMQTLADGFKLGEMFDADIDISQSNTPGEIREAFSAHLCQEENLPVCRIFAYFQIGDGLSVHTTPEGHDDIYSAMVEAYDTGWTTQKQGLKDIYELMLEYYDEAYALAYDYAVSEGYIGEIVDVIDTALNAVDIAIDEIEANAPGLTVELQVKVLNELNAAVDTLEKIKLLVSKNGRTVDGLVAGVLDLENDLKMHLKNAEIILEQAEVDVVYGLELANKIVNEELIPTFLTMSEEFAWVAIDYLLTNIDVIYYNFPEIANEVYTKALEAIIMAQIFVGRVVDTVVDVLIDVYYKVLDTAMLIYDNLDEAYAFASELFITVVTTLVEVNDKTGGLIDELMLEALGVTLDEALQLLEDLCFYVYDNKDEALAALKAILEDVVDKANGEIAKGVALYNAILDVLVDVYDNMDNVVIVSSQIFSYVYDYMVEDLTLAQVKEHCDNIVDLIAETYRGTKDINAVGEEIYAYAVTIFADTFSGDYIITKDSLYVSLGNAVYGEELAEMLYLSDKYQNFALDEEYAEVIADADFITIQFHNGEMIDFALTQLLSGGGELDWDKHLDAEGQAALDEMLEVLKEQLVSTGAANELATVLKDSIGDSLGDLTGTGIDINDETVAEVLAYATECLIYAYADLIDRIEAALDTVYAEAPEAMVVITGLENTLADLGLEELGVDISEYTDMLDLVIDGFNLQLVAIAFANENTIYVDSSEAADIYAALNVTCAHDYDDCEDEICNICGEKRVAPGHTYGEYVDDKNVTCTEDGTMTRACSACGYKDSISVEALGHLWGEWVVVKEATRKHEGYREHTCQRCGLTIGEPTLMPTPLPILPPIILGVIIIAGIAYYYYKKKKASVPATNEEKTDADENNQ